jgi:hypothetical protein
VLYCARWGPSSAARAGLDAWEHDDEEVALSLASLALSLALALSLY